MSLEIAIEKAVASVPECVAAGYVDMATGMLLGAKTTDSQPVDALDLIAASAADLFQGANVSSIEKMFKDARGITDENHQCFKEIVVFSDNLLQVLLRGQRHTDHAVMFLCRKSANIGMVLTKSRLALPELEKELS